MEHPLRFNTIPEAIEDIKQGKLVIVVDDEDRENEGDFVTAAENVTPEIINFMSREGRGLICVPLSEKRCNELGLDMMVSKNTAAYETAFTVSVDLIGHGCTTGISASDRAKTVQALANPNTDPEELGRPGHIFPLKAKSGGVLRRAGHTEAAVDLARLAGFNPAGILVEIMREDGEMARVPDLIHIAKKFDMKFITIKDLIAYRIETETLVKEVMDINMPTMFGDFKVHAFEEKLTGDIHLALTKGSWTIDEPVLTRVHSADMLGDIFGSRHKDTGNQLHQAMLQVEREGKGIVLFMNRSQSGSILINQLKSLGKNTTHEDELFLQSDYRDYGVGAQILCELGIRKLRLLTNHPVKRIGIKSFGLEIVDQVNFEDDFSFLTSKNSFEKEEH